LRRHRFLDPFAGWRTLLELVVFHLGNSLPAIDKTIYGTSGRRTRDWRVVGMACACALLLAPQLLFAADVRGESSGDLAEQQPVVRPLPPVFSPDASAPPPGMPARGPLPTSAAPPPAAVNAVLSGNASQYESIRAGGSELMLIDLASAWRLAARQNPTIGLARQVVEENLANLLRARVIAVPNLNAGANYHAHNGNLQRSSGQILSVPEEQSLYVGGGARTVAAESVGIPAVQIFAPLADVFYMPLAAQQDLNASNFNVRATYNSILLSVTTAYLELMGAEASFSAYRRSELDMADVLRPTLEFARVGEGLDADANRVRAAALILRGKTQRAEGSISVASAQLSKLLQLNPSVALRTPAAPLALVSVVDPNDSLASLVSIALRYRPEVGTATSEVAAADVRFRQERIRPLLPTMWLGFSSGTFGGGSTYVDPLYGSFSGRSDFDVMALWTLQNAGAGNAAWRNQKRAQRGEAVANRTIIINQIRDEVASARADAAAQLRAVKVAQVRLATAEDGYRREVQRSRANLGHPIEALNMVDLLVDARQQLVASIVAYNAAEFRLYVAMGFPPPMANPVAPPEKIDGATTEAIEAVPAPRANR
jgi:outer membrane protein TolC